jgi:hypothetical protein
LTDRGELTRKEIKYHVNNCGEDNESRKTIKRNFGEERTINLTINNQKQKIK